MAENTGSRVFRVLSEEEERALGDAFVACVRKHGWQKVEKCECEECRTLRAVSSRISEKPGCPVSVRPDDYPRRRYGPPFSVSGPPPGPHYDQIFVDFLSKSRMGPFESD